MGFRFVSFLNSAVAYEFAMICKVGARFLCRFVCLTWLNSHYIVLCQWW